MKTYDTLFRIPVHEVVRIFREGGCKIEKTQLAISARLHCIRDPLFKITGGSLMRLPNGMFVLVGGQSFDGQYDPLGGRFDQRYTNEIRYFRLDPRRSQFLTVVA